MKASFGGMALVVGAVKKVFRERKKELFQEK